MATLIYDTNNWLRVRMNESGDKALITDFWYEVLNNAKKGDLQIFACEGINGNKARRDLYPEYKMTRKPADISIYDGINFFKNLLIHAPASVLRAEAKYYEGDDVIACLAENLPKPLHIITTDRDLTALRCIPGVTTLAEPKTDPRWVRLYKTLVGDPADNIKGIPGFGPKAWDNLGPTTKNLLEQYFLGNINSDNNVLIQNLSCDLGPKLRDSAIELLQNGTLSIYYKIIGFMPLKLEDIVLKAGDNKTHLVDLMFNELSLDTLE